MTNHTNTQLSDVPEALSRASKLCRSTIPGARVELIFQNLEDAQAVHKWLVNLKASPVSPSPTPEQEKPGRVYGWILGNEYQERGYYDEGDKGDAGEFWYYTVDGESWSALDVSFWPEHVFNGVPHPNDPTLLLCDFVFHHRRCDLTKRRHDELFPAVPPSTQPSARVAAEEVMRCVLGFNEFDDLAQLSPENGNRRFVTEEVAAIISRHFPSVQPVEEQPLYTQGNREAAIRLLRELREITDPEEIQRQKDSWAQLEAALNPAAATADNDSELSESVDSAANFIKQYERDSVGEEGK